MRTCKRFAAHDTAMCYAHQLPELGEAMPFMAADGWLRIRAYRRSGQHSRSPRGHAHRRPLHPRRTVNAAPPFQDGAIVAGKPHDVAVPPPPPDSDIW